MLNNSPRNCGRTPSVSFASRTIARSRLCVTSPITLFSRQFRTGNSRENSQLGDFVDANFGVGLKQWLQTADHITREEVGAQVCLGIFDGVEAVSNLHVLIANEEVLGLGALRLCQEWLLVLRINRAGCAAIFSRYIEGHFQINHDS